MEMRKKQNALLQFCFKNFEKGYLNKKTFMGKKHDIYVSEIPEPDLEIDAHLEKRNCEKNPKNSFVSVIFTIQEENKVKNFSHVFNCIVSITDATGESRFRQSINANLELASQDTDGNKVYLGIEEYIKFSTLFSLKEELLPGDTLTILCDITIEWWEETDENMFQRYETREWTELCKTVADPSIIYGCFLSEVYETDQMFNSDSIWKILGYEISASNLNPEREAINLLPWKEKLCNSSPYFEHMFSSGLMESETGILYVPRWEYLVFALMIFLVLHNDLEFELHEDTLFRLYLMADKYMVDSVKKMCANNIMEYINVENVVVAYLLAHKHNEYEIKEAAANIILSNWVCMKKANGWSKLKRLEPDLYEELLGMHTEKVNNSLKPEIKQKSCPVPKFSSIWDIMISKDSHEFYQ